MTRFLTALTLLLLIQAAPALAQIDPYPDGLGVYFDEQGMTNTTTAEVGETVHAYLVGTKWTVTGETDHWQGVELAVWPRGVSNPELTFTIVPRDGGVNLFDDQYSIGRGFDVYYGAEPFVFSQTTVLADVYIPVDYAEPTEVFLMGAVFAELLTGESVYIEPHYWHDEMPPPIYYVAGINVDVAPVEAETQAWGDVKALYR